MKALILHGSNRKNGNTERISKLFAAELMAQMSSLGEEIEFEEIRLGSRNIHLCKGCRICFNRGEEFCPLKDDVLEIREAMRRADFLILTSPVYVGDCTGIVKNWIDRLAFVCHRPEFAGKTAYLITTTGSLTAMGHVFFTLGTALATWGYQITGKKEYTCGALTAMEDLRARYAGPIAKEAEKTSKKLIRKKKIVPTFLSLMTFRIQQATWSLVNPDTCDARYWREKGWTDRSVQYYTDHRASNVKVYAARVLGTLISRFAVTRKDD